MKKVLLYIVVLQFAFGIFMVGFIFVGALKKPKHIVAEYERRYGPITVSMNDIPIGDLKIVTWGGYPIAILHRTPAQIESINRSIGVLDPESKQSKPAPWFEERDRLMFPDKIANKNRSIIPEYLVVFWFSTNTGCSLFYHTESQPFYDHIDNAMLLNSGGMFFDMCSGSIFDLAGRTLYNSRSKFPYNLMIPKYSVNQGSITIGVVE